MAFRIDPQLPADAEIRRVIDEQLRKAAKELRVEGGPDAEGVHDARKRIKKARSTLRLARADLGASVVRHANAELREVGQALAAEREADALVESVDLLTDSLTAEPESEPELEPGADEPDGGPDPALTAALDRLRAGLAAEAEALRGDAVDVSTARGAARRLEMVATWLDRVPPHAEGWRAIGPGLARQHHRGHQARDVVLDVTEPDQPRVEDLHEWRKRVKDLWYHERLLRRLWPEAQAPIVAAAGELADLLGQDHDLGLLNALLQANTEPAPDASADPDPDAAAGPASEPLVSDDDRDRIVVAAAARRAALQARARHLGALLYADDPAAWEARHRAWWRATA